jgi:hypothetical protein
VLTLKKVCNEIKKQQPKDIQVAEGIMQRGLEHEESCAALGWRSFVSSAKAKIGASIPRERLKELIILLLKGEAVQTGTIIDSDMLEGDGDANYTLTQQDIGLLTLMLDTLLLPLTLSRHWLH